MARLIPFSLACVAAFSPFLSRAATAPFSETFDSYTTGNTLPTGFTETTGTGGGTGGTNASAITIEDDGSGKDYQFSLTTTGQLNASTQFTNVVGNNFAVSVEFTLDSLTNSGGVANSGIVILGTDVNVSAGNRYYANFTSLGAAAGTLSISPFGATTTATSTSASTLSVSSGAAAAIYTLTVTGTYATPGIATSALTIFATVTDGTNSISTTLTDTAPLTGTNFGLRSATSTAGTNIDFDNFNVALVPEPATAALLVGGVAILGLRRRRR